MPTRPPPAHLPAAPLAQAVAGEQDHEDTCHHMHHRNQEEEKMDLQGARALAWIMRKCGGREGMQFRSARAAGLLSSRLVPM